MWRLCKLGYRNEPRLMLASFVLSQLAALPDALLALWLMLLGKGVLAQRSGLIEGAAIGLAVSTAATWFLRHGERAHSAPLSRQGDDCPRRACCAPAGDGRDLAHHERPEYLDRLSMLRNQVFVLDHMYMSLFSTLGWILRLGRDHGVIGVDSSRALAASGVRHSNSVDLNVAAGGGALRAGAWRASRPAVAPPVCVGHHRTAREGSACHRDRGSASSPIAGRHGIAGISRYPRRAGVPRSGMRWVGRYLGWLMWARWSLSPRICALPPALCCWCWPQAHVSPVI